MDSRLRGNDGWWGGTGRSLAPSFVIPAHAGIHGRDERQHDARGARAVLATMDPGVRRDDDGGQSEPASPLTPPA